MIPFNQPYYSGKERKFIAQAMDTKVLSGSTEVVQACEQFLEQRYGFGKAYLTNSCTMALEMAALLIGIAAGDEVIMPSYTYVSTANAFALRGAKIVFADSLPDHPNMDVSKLEQLITSRTKAIVVMHYGAVACDMDVVMRVAKKHNLLVIEDAAQCIDAYYKDKALGAIGDIGCFSFHETKNIHCGEGGFLAINNPLFFERAEIIRNKGTNRSAFSKGAVTKYEWCDLGFSSLPSSLSAAFLWAQLQKINSIQRKRMSLWNGYANRIKRLKCKHSFSKPLVPDFAKHNGHIFFLVCSSVSERNRLIDFLQQAKIHAVFHYQVLHKSPFQLAHADPLSLPNAERFGDCLLRLPLFFELTITEQTYICSKLEEFYSV